MPTISIIVPVYNAEEYLHRCLDSVIKQTFKDIEIILVDDGSTDKSSMICDEYSLRDSRVKVIHQKNGGPSKARNTGIDCAKGLFYGFVDSDDFIEPTMYETLYDDSIKNDCQISVCGHMEHKENVDAIKFYKLDMHKVFATEEAINNMLLGEYFAGHLCTKLFDARLFDGTRLNEKIKVCEDLLLSVDLMQKSKRVCFNAQPLYNYMIRSGSQYHRAFSAAQYTSHEAHEIIISNFAKNAPNSIKYAQVSGLTVNMRMLNLLRKNRNESDKKYFKEIQRNIRHYVNPASIKIVKQKNFNSLAPILLAFANYRLYYLTKDIGSKLRSFVKYMRK